MPTLRLILFTYLHNENCFITIYKVKAATSEEKLYVVKLQSLRNVAFCKKNE